MTTPTRLPSPLAFFNTTCSVQTSTSCALATFDKTACADNSVFFSFTKRGEDYVLALQNQLYGYAETLFPASDVVQDPDEAAGCERLKAPTEFVLDVKQ